MKATQTVQAPTQPTDVRSALKEGIARLDAAGVPSSKLAAELLLIHALGRDRTWLYAHATDPLDLKATQEYFALIARRSAGEPVQYIVGKQEFWGLEFEVTPAVLIPRPETEHLIEVTLERIGVKRRPEYLRIADIGTGSGCIAVTLAKELPNANFVATDISAEALHVAHRNAARHAVMQRIEFMETDLLNIWPGERNSSHSPLVTSHSLPGQKLFDVIVSNPPYIAHSDAASLQREVRDHEPRLALFGGPTGVEIYSRLIEQAEALLEKRGFLILELGYDSADRVRAMIDSSGAWKNVAITNDLGGIPRVLAAERA